MSVFLGVADSKNPRCAPSVADIEATVLQAAVQFPAGRGYLGVEPHLDKVSQVRGILTAVHSLLKEGIISPEGGDNSGLDGVIAGAAGIVVIDPAAVAAELPVPAAVSQRLTAIKAGGFIFIGLLHSQLISVLYSNMTRKCRKSNARPWWRSAKCKTLRLPQFPWANDFSGDSPKRRIITGCQGEFQRILHDFRLGRKIQDGLLHSLLYFASAAGVHTGADITNL